MTLETIINQILFTCDRDWILTYP